MKLIEKENIVESSGLEREDTEVWHRKYISHKCQAVRRGLSSELTFSQYVEKAAEADLKTPDMIGSEKGKFNLGRVGDIGNYQEGNCRFIPAVQNVSEAHQNGRHDNAYAIIGEAARRHLLGQTKETSERIRKMAESQTGKTKENDPGRAAQADKLAKEFVLTAPDGAIYRGKNVVEFCKEHGLQHANLYGVFAGRKSHHKGWTGQYVAPEAETLK